MEHVCNLTDVDDKIIKRMARDNVSLQDLTNKYAMVRTYIRVVVRRSRACLLAWLAGRAFVLMVVWFVPRTDMRTLCDLVACMHAGVLRGPQGAEHPPR